MLLCFAEQFTFAWANSLNLIYQFAFVELYKIMTRDRFHVPAVQNQQQHLFMRGDVSQDRTHEEALLFVSKLETAPRRVRLRSSLVGKSYWTVVKRFASADGSIRAVVTACKGETKIIWQMSQCFQQPAQLSCQPGWFSLVFVSLNGDEEEMASSVYARMTEVLSGVFPNRPPPLTPDAPVS